MKNSVHRGGVRGRGVCMVGGMCRGVGAGGHAWQGRDVRGRGGGMRATHAPRQILRDTVDERALRILLECILVSDANVKTDCVMTLN